MRKENKELIINVTSIDEFYSLVHFEVKNETFSCSTALPLHDDFVDSDSNSISECEEYKDILNALSIDSGDFDKIWKLNETIFEKINEQLKTHYALNS